MRDPTPNRESERVSVLFLCTGNACRSQMAEGWTRHFHGDRYDVYSAGIEPKGIDARSVAVMAESGVDISGQRSKHVDELLNIPFDLIITVCDSAREACPLLPGGGKKFHRSFDDPAGIARNAVDEEEALNHYRRIRDEIRDFIIGLPGMIRQMDIVRE